MVFKWWKISYYRYSWILCKYKRRNFKFEAEYKDAQGFKNLTEKIKITDPSSGYKNTTPNINFKIKQSDNLFDENTNIEFDFDLNNLNKDPEGFQKDSIQYRFLGKGYGSWSRKYDWKALDENYKFNLNKEYFSGLKKDINRFLDWVHHTPSYRRHNGRYQHNWESYIHKYRFTDYAIELSYLDGKGNRETITSSELFTLKKSKDFDLDTEYNGNLTGNLKLNKDSQEYKLEVGNIEKDPDGIANIKYLSYRWYKDNNLIKTSNNSLIIDKNDYFGNWKVDVEYKDDNNFRNIVSSTLNIKDDKKNNISFL